MTVQQAIAAHLAKIEAAGQQRKATPLPNTAHELPAQWIATMRAYLDNYIEGITVSNKDVKAWRLQGEGDYDFAEGSYGSYTFIWPLTEGRIWANNLTLADLEQPCSAWWWNARHYEFGSDFSLPSLTAALTFAQTGKILAR